MVENDPHADPKAVVTVNGGEVNEFDEVEGGEPVPEPVPFIPKAKD